jgi:hypothetical protein
VIVAAHRTASQRQFGSAGLKVWQQVTDEYELDQHELALLREICRTLDSLDDLQKHLDKDGVMVQKSFEDRVINPCLNELRQQRLVLAKLVAALHLPQGLADGLAPAAPKQRTRKTKFAVVRDVPGMS